MHVDTIEVSICITCAMTIGYIAQGGVWYQWNRQLVVSAMLGVAARLGETAQVRDTMSSMHMLCLRCVCTFKIELCCNMCLWGLLLVGTWKPCVVAYSQ